MDALIATSSAGFLATTGFNISDLVTWTGTNLIELFIGSGVALLFNLRYWIVALVIIAAIIYFSFRAFQFFRH